MNTTLIIILYIIVFICYFQQSKREGIMTYQKIKKFIENNVKHRSHNTWDWGYGPQDKGNDNDGKSDNKKTQKKQRQTNLIKSRLPWETPLQWNSPYTGIRGYHPPVIDRSIISPDSCT
jgi:hypothetical protein